MDKTVLDFDSAILFTLSINLKLIQNHIIFNVYYKS